MCLAFSTVSRGGDAFKVGYVIVERVVVDVVYLEAVWHRAIVVFPDGDMEGLSRSVEVSAVRWPIGLRVSVVGVPVEHDALCSLGACRGSPPCGTRSTAVALFRMPSDKGCAAALTLRFKWLVWHTTNLSSVVIWPSAIQPLFWVQIL